MSFGGYTVAELKVRFPTPDGDLLGIDGYSLRARESWLAVRLTREEWDALTAYDVTVPNGVIIGKRWTRTDRDGQWIGRMGCDIDGIVEIVFSPAIIA